MMVCRLCGAYDVDAGHACAVQDLKNHAHRLAEEVDRLKTAIETVLASPCTMGADDIDTLTAALD